MTPEALKEHQQALARLEDFRLALLNAVNQSGEAKDKLLPAVEKALSAECNQCGIRVTGAELLAEPPSDSTTTGSAKLQRLRRGDCARSGCDSAYYKLMFADHPDINWTRLLERAKSVRVEERHAPSAETTASPTKSWQDRKPLVVRAVLALVLLLVLLAARQWYRGGTLPLIRQPEHFQVDRLPNEQAEAERLPQ